MGLDLRLQHKMSQQLVMTPQLQQAIKLLQLSHLEMAQTLQQELAQNPVLEEVDGTGGEAASQALDALAQDGHGPLLHAAATGPEQAAASLQTGAGEEGAAPAELGGQEALPLPGDGLDPRDLDAYSPSGFASEGALQAASWENVQAQATSLTEHLRWQVHMANLDEDERAVALYLVEEIDDDGYLQADVLGACEQALQVDAQQVARALALVQDFDPVGVAARDLRECLLLQARARGSCSDVTLAILEHHLKAVEGRHFGKIAKALRVGVDVVIQAVRELAYLEPRPGRAFAQGAPAYIVPDLFVTPAPGQDGEFYVAVNEEGLPKLGISSYYGDGDKFTGKTRTYVQEKLRAASWLLRSVHMRKRTMVRVMRSILTYQHAFFSEGGGPLRPMVLRDVAQDLGMHESTISRVTTNKYVHTPHGIYELKFFFNSTIRSSQGEGLASESVRQKIMRFIDRENKNEPLSDQKIVELLRGHDISIARRTVAKYRKMLNKQPSSVRRRDF